MHMTQLTARDYWASVKAAAFPFPLLILLKNVLGDG